MILNIITSCMALMLLLVLSEETTSDVPAVQVVNRQTGGDEHWVSGHTEFPWVTLLQWCM